MIETIRDQWTNGIAIVAGLARDCRFISRFGVSHGWFFGELSGKQRHCFLSAGQFND